MAKQDREFWIDVTPEDSKMELKLETALDVCHEIYLWALDRTIELWMETKEIPKVGNISRELTLRIKKNTWYRDVQRYTLNRVIEIAVSQFHQELEIQEDGVIKFPVSRSRDSFNEFKIPVRGIWKKYLEEHSRISTAYGLLFMEGEWQKILQQQAKSSKVTMIYMPYLWHNVTIRKTESIWQIHFNLHEVNSHQGKIAQQKMKREGFKIK